MSSVATASVASLSSSASPTAVASSCARAACAGASASPTMQPSMASIVERADAERVVVELVGELERRTRVLERRRRSPS